MLQESTRNNKFPKKLRILKRREFLFAQKNKGCSHDSMLVIVSKTDKEIMRLGVVVSKKIGNAVVRNYYKRIFRDYFRNNKSFFVKGYDYVIIARKNIVSYSFEQLKDIFLRLVEEINEKNINSSS